MFAPHFCVRPPSGGLKISVSVPPQEEASKIRAAKTPPCLVAPFLGMVPDHGSSDSGKNDGRDAEVGASDGGLRRQRVHDPCRAQPGSDPLSNDGDERRRRD